ncbi:MAG: hypothetical protein GY906_30155 [bacterium]|nr:hypothetical protein [bacterium]
MTPPQGASRRRRKKKPTKSGYVLRLEGRVREASQAAQAATDPIRRDRFQKEGAAAARRLREIRAYRREKLEPSGLIPIPGETR